MSGAGEPRPWLTGAALAALGCALGCQPSCGRRAAPPVAGPPPGDAEVVTLALDGLGIEARGAWADGAFGPWVAVTDTFHEHPYRALRADLAGGSCR